MLPFYRKLLLLLWKCCILRKKNWVLSLLELLCPILVMLAAYFLYKFGSEDNENCFGGAYEDSYIQPLLKSVNRSSNYPLKYLAYSPNTSFAKMVMESVCKNGNLTSVKMEQLLDQKELDSWLQSKTKLHKESESIGIEFLEINSTEKSFTYKIRSNSGNITTKQTKVQIYQRTNSYFKSSFLLIQTLIDAELLNSTNCTNGGKDIYFGSLPARKDTYAFAIYMLYLFVMLAYVFLVASVVREVILEKETGIKELMKILGVSNWMIWTHWLIYTLIVHLPVTIGVTIILTVVEPTILKTNSFIVWLLFFFFTIDCTFLFFAVSCLFNGAVRGTTVCVIGWFIVNTSTWVFIDTPGDFELYAQIFMCLIPLHNLCWVIYTLFSFSSNGKEWDFNDFYTQGFTGCQISVGFALLIFFLQTVFWVLLFIFLDAVKPGPYGVSKSFNFFCNCCVKLWSKKQQTELNVQSLRASLPNRFEVPTQGAKVGIKIQGLRKEYGLFKKVVAVECVDLEIYEGEIMALLGHNGAGKTTTMSIITGMFSATKGKILVDGKDINSELSQFRHSLGLCTQHDMYFPKLTVLEHLLFFGMLKGMSYSNAKNSGLEILSLLNLLEKQNCKVCKLSGGMKRRLCLAMSLIGDPKVLILDEPTSGLDPENRHQIWNIILKMRGSRTILITTHFMEEADTLGDRIAIMDRGQVVCCGTTMFLKKIYGTGYNIHILKHPDYPAEGIYTEVSSHIDKPKMKIVSPLQVDFVIKEVFVKQFPKLFESLENQRQTLGITSISVTCTTLEDVFLRVAEKFAEGDQKEEKEDVDFLETAKSRLSSVHQLVIGPSLFFQRLETLVWKYLIYRYRNCLSSLVKLISSIVLVVLLVLYSQFDPEKILPTKALVMDLHIYSRATVLLSNDTKNYDIANISKNVIQKLGGSVEMLPNGENITDHAKNLDKFSTNNYIHNIILALQFTNNSFTVLYQPLIKLHTPPIAVNLIGNILLRNSSGDKNGNITIINHPYVLPEDEKCGRTDFFKTITPFLWMFFIFFVMVILMMDFIPFITEERCSGFKHQQFIAGLSPLLYWVSNFVLDFFVYVCMISICLLVLLTFGRDAITWGSQWMGLATLVLILYGLTGILFLYTFTFLVDSSVMCSGMFLLGNMALTLIPAVVLYLDIVKSFTLYFGLIVLFSFNPTFAATISIGYIAKAITEEQLCIACGEMYCMSKTESLWKIPTAEDKSGILLYVMFLGLCWILYLCLIVVIEWDLGRVFFLTFLHKKADISTQPALEDDVKKEIELVLALKESDNLSKPLLVEGLVKKYLCGPKAVNLVTFVVDKGECFGLLGVNGAGKTTTFKILTGEVLPNSGEAFVLDSSVLKNRQKYLSSIGYCPQFDALLNVLTGEETLKTIARLRGISRKKIKGEVDFLLTMLGISKHAKKRTVTYSGGTKRKLSTALAFIGNPEIVFLDEPTTGVDPVSRRKLWSVVQIRQKIGQAVVLTSHSMEECEALCNRLTIMKAGQMQCIGTTEYLKQKYGKGFSVHLKIVDATESKLNELKTEFFSTFPTSVVKDEHISLIRYQILDTTVSLSKIFIAMLKIKQKFEIVEDFSVSNTTLEQLFLSFTEEELPSRRKSIFSLFEKKSNLPLQS